MDKKFILGIDIGGTTGKAGLYDLKGNEISTEKSSFKMISPHDGWFERDVTEVLESVYGMIRNVLQKTKTDPQEILGVGITSYTNGAFFVDENGKSVYKNNCILAGDTRSKDLIRSWELSGVKERVEAITCQQLWAGQAITAIAWMKENEPAVFEKTRYILSCADYLRFFLTGNAAAEITNASTASLIDLDRRIISKEVFDLLGVSEGYEKMPAKLLNPTDIAGYITKEAGEKTGLAEGTPVVGGLADVTANCIGTGVYDPSRLCVTFGTWSINEYISKTPIRDPYLFMTAAYCMPEYYLILEGSTTSASNLQWYVERFLGEEAMQMKAQGKNVYDACEEMIASVPYDDSTIVFLPFLFGTNVNMDAKSAFIGINGRHSKAHMLRAVYEGIAFSHWHHMDKLIHFRGGKPDAIRISGGGAASDEWCQMFADMLQVPVEVPNAKELGALGVAMSVTVGCGLYPDFGAAAKELTSVRKIYRPNPEREEYYARKFAVYNKLIDALDTTWKDLTALEK